MNRVITKLLPIIDRITGTQDAVVQIFILMYYALILVILVGICVPFLHDKIKIIYKKYYKIIVQVEKIILIPVLVVVAVPIGAALGACYLTGKWVMALWER